MAPSLLERIARTAADRIAVEDTDERLTYGDLYRQALDAGRALTTRFGQGGYIVIPAEPTARFVVTLLGVMASANAPIPVDPALPPAGLETVLSTSRASGLVSADRSRMIDGPAQPFGTPRLTDLPALIMFTSGSTGRPKGVIISRDNLASACEAMATYLEYRRYPSAAVVLPLHYSYALLSQVCCQLWIGGRVRIFPDLRNPLRVAELVESGRIATFCGVPSTFHALTSCYHLKPFTMASVRIVCSAGAAMEPSRFAAVRHIFPRATFFNNYGMTEAAPRIAYIRDDDPRFAEPTCGRPMAGVEVRIVDPDTHEPVPDGQAGMLVVRGPNVTSGYLNDPEQTRQAFTADGFLISGDIARLDRGYIFIEGRHDDIFNCGGEKVAPIEIETMLQSVPGVDAAAVAGVPDEARGMVPVAYLRLSRPVTRRSLVDVLSTKLTRVKIPVHFYEVREFPMTSNGKLQRKRLVAEGDTFAAREIT